MANKSDYIIRKTFGPNVIKNHVYNDRAKSVKDVNISPPADFVHLVDPANPQPGSDPVPLMNIPAFSLSPRIPAMDIAEVPATQSEFSVVATSGLTGTGGSPALEDDIDVTNNYILTIDYTAGAITRIYTVFYTPLAVAGLLDSFNAAGTVGAIIDGASILGLDTSVNNQIGRDAIATRINTTLVGISGVDGIMYTTGVEGVGIDANPIVLNSTNLTGAGDPRVDASGDLVMTLNARLGGGPSGGSAANIDVDFVPNFVGGTTLSTDQADAFQGSGNRNRVGFDGNLFDFEGGSDFIPFQMAGSTFAGDPLMDIPAGSIDPGGAAISGDPEEPEFVGRGNIVRIYLTPDNSGATPYDPAGVESYVRFTDAEGAATLTDFLEELAAGTAVPADNPCPADGTTVDTIQLPVPTSSTDVSDHTIIASNDYLKFNNADRINYRIEVTEHD